MGSYLDYYGAAEASRARRMTLVKRGVMILALLLVVGGILYALFKNYPEEQQVKTFLGLLQKKDYAAAYEMWGCTEANPCRDYSMARFLDDWGPKGVHGDFSGARVGSTESCGTGVMVDVTPASGEAARLWVERGSRVLAFAPWSQCPGRHWHFGAFFRRLFHRDEQ